MLFAGWEVRMVKNCDRGLENTARGRRPRAAFQDRGTREFNATFSQNISPSVSRVQFTVKCPNRTELERLTGSVYLS